MDVDIWTYRGVTPTELIGYSVEAADGKIGKVDEATYDVGRSYVVVDTGPWIFGRKVLLPAHTIAQFDPEAERIFVDRTKDEIKNGPEYDSNTWSMNTSRSDYDRYYGPFYRG
jgi:hypothetical protein